jgi:hypothetical protein
MDNVENLREGCKALEQRTEQLKQQTRTDEQRRWWRLTWRVAAMAVLGLALASPPLVQAKTFQCGAGDVSCLIAAITEANTNGEKNTIRLAAGTYTLTAVDNGIFVLPNGGIHVDPNGLPVITSLLTITGQGAETTIIERDLSAPEFRILEIATAGSLTLKGLTLRHGVNGSGGLHAGGGGINNHGTLHISHCTIANNRGVRGAGIHTEGTLRISHCTIADNHGDLGGGITNQGSVHLTRSTLANNSAGHGGGGLLNAGGTVIIARTTFTGNSADGGGGLENSSNFFDRDQEGFVSITNSTFESNMGTMSGAISNGGSLSLVNTTVAHNTVFATWVGNPGGLTNFGTVVMQNTLLALNNENLRPPFPFPVPVDCDGVITSLGHNLIGDPTGCTITLRPSDLTGDPGIATFTDDGTPGQGHFPLLPTSQAIDAGNDAVCPRRDQLGQRRMNIPKVGTSRCDIGAIEFRPPDEEDDHHDKDLAATAQAFQ